MSLLLLVRHGQASFGASDYDVLSPTGHRQSQLLGKALAERGTSPARVIHGGMRRQAETAAGLLESTGWPVSPTVDSRWAEFDHQRVVEVHRPDIVPGAPLPPDLAQAADPRKAFQAAFLEATARWTSGEHDGDYRETFRDFAARSRAALADAAAGDGVTVVVTSGGVIGLLTSVLLTGDTQSWSRANSVAVNSGVTRVLSGATGLTLLTFNEHTHLEQDRSLITYR